MSQARESANSGPDNVKPLMAMRGHRQMRLFHSGLTGNVYATSAYRERADKPGMIEVTGKKHDVTADAQGIVDLVAGGLWDLAKAALERESDPERREQWGLAIARYEEFMAGHESVVFS